MIDRSSVRQPKSQLVFVSSPGRDLVVVCANLCQPRGALPNGSAVLSITISPPLLILQFHIVIFGISVHIHIFYTLMYSYAPAQYRYSYT
jgi:hypothetical protein